MTQHFLTISDLNKDQLQEVLALSKAIENNLSDYNLSLAGKNVLFCFEKPSFRTLVGTEAALNNCGASVIHTTPDAFLGGNIIYAGKDLGEREPLKDTIRISNHYADALFLRVFSHKTLLSVCQYAEIPVINALCDMNHPCQALADYYTIIDCFGGNTKIHVCFTGDATNVAYSLAELVLIFGHKFTWSGPKDFCFTTEQLTRLKEIEVKYGGRFEIEPDLVSALKSANVIVTDTFVSMGQEEAHDKRVKALMSYQINKDTWSHVDPEAIFLHCLPAHRGYEVTEEVIDGPQSRIIEEAKNRMVTARGLFNFLISK